MYYSPARCSGSLVLSLLKKEMKRHLAREKLTAINGLGRYKGHDPKGQDYRKPSPGSINVLVTDVIMPQVRGFELAELVTEIHPEMRVIFMSGYSVDALVG